jgi:death-on-curing protein
VDIALQAAVLAHGIARSQSFIDGNKRTALAAMLVFLELNGYGMQATDREMADWIIDFSRGATPERVAEMLRPRLTEIA